MLVPKYYYLYNNELLATVTPDAHFVKIEENLRRSYKLRVGDGTIIQFPVKFRFGTSKREKDLMQGWIEDVESIGVPYEIENIVYRKKKAKRLTMYCQLIAAMNPIELKEYGDGDS